MQQGRQHLRKGGGKAATGSFFKTGGTNRRGMLAAK